MKLFYSRYICILILAFAISITGCKKKIFSPLTFSGKVINSSTSEPAENCAVVLYKKKGSLIAKTGIFKDTKEIGRASTASDGSFSMNVKWLDNRDQYYVIILYNNSPRQIYSNNADFTNYKALESSVEFKVNL